MYRLFTKRVQSRRWLLRFPRVLPIAIFGLIATISVLSVFAIERTAEQRELSRLEERAQAIGSAIERRASANASYIRAGAALFGSTEGVTPARFRRFVSELQLESDFQGAEGFGWAMRVDRENIDAFNQLVAGEYGPGVMLRPSIGPDQAYAMPVAMFEPDSVFNRDVLGFDMYSEAARRTAMIEAERAASPIASGKVALLQGGLGSSSGFVMFMPVFSGDGASERLEGYVFSVFNVVEFLESALQLEAAGDLGIQVYDEMDGRANLLAKFTAREPAGPVVKEKILLASRPWVLEITGPSKPLLTPLSLATLAFGMVAAGLAMVLVRILTRQATEDGERLAWYEDQNAIRDSLTRELNHRVKNTLANVLSIIALTRRRASSIDEFAEGLDGRIRALSATHDLLTQSDWGSTPVGSVIEAELAPYARQLGPVITIDGPAIKLVPKDALSLGLAIHELATNAAKYGSLGVAEGKLDIHWGEAEKGVVTITWVESGGPPVPAERKRGFGLDLIEKIVAHELQNPVNLQFDPAGVRCTIHVPVRAPSKFFEVRPREA